MRLTVCISVNEALSAYLLCGLNQLLAIILTKAMLSAINDSFFMNRRQSHTEIRLIMSIYIYSKNPIRGDKTFLFPLCLL